MRSHWLYGNSIIIQTMDFGTILNQHNEKIDYAYHEGKSHTDTLVIIGHGVTGNKDRPFVTALAEGLAGEGYPALRFSFTGNGDSEGTFQESRISKEVEDLRSILDVVADGEKTIVYAGHSMGGAVGVLTTSKDSRINKLVSLAGMVHTAKFCKVEFGDQIPGKGFMWDEPDCPLSEKYVDDMNSIGSVLEKGTEISVPWLLIHGTEDDVVPIDETHEIFEKAGENAQKIVLEGADHVFSKPVDVSKMIEAIVSWLSS